MDKSMIKLVENARKFIATDVYEPVRVFHRFHLLTACQRSPRFCELSGIDQYTTANDIETGCYNESVLRAQRMGIVCCWNKHEFKDKYEIIFRRIYTNIDPESMLNARANNPYYVIDSILDGTINPLSIGAMTSIEMHPELSVVEREFIHNQRPSDIEEKESLIYQCRYCNSRKVRIEAKQTRGADEAESVFVYCSNCHKRIK